MWGFLFCLFVFLFFLFFVLFFVFAFCFVFVFVFVCLFVFCFVFLAFCFTRKASADGKTSCSFCEPLSNIICICMCNAH